MISGSGAGEGPGGGEGEPGGGRLQLQFAQMCVSKSEGRGSFLWPQVSEMSEIVSLKMGVKYVSSLIMGEKLPQKLYMIICRNAISGHI